MRELLQRVFEIFDPITEGQEDLLIEISTELLRPVEPDYFVYENEHMTRFRPKRCEDFIKQKYKETPLFTHPPANPVLLSDEQIYFLHHHSGIDLPISKSLCEFGRAVEQAVLKANGIGGVE